MLTKNVNGQNIECTAEEESEIRAGWTKNDEDAESIALKVAAQAALDASDLTALRCFKASVAFPDEWTAYVKNLRTVLKSGSGVIPIRPAYPAGT